MKPKTVAATVEGFYQRTDDPKTGRICAELTDLWEKKQRGELSAEEYKKLKDEKKRGCHFYTPHAHFKKGYKRSDGEPVDGGAETAVTVRVDEGGNGSDGEPEKDDGTPTLTMQVGYDGQGSYAGSIYDDGPYGSSYARVSVETKVLNPVYFLYNGLISLAFTALFYVCAAELMKRRLSV